MKALSLRPGNPMGRAMMITLFLQLIAFALAIPVMTQLAGVPVPTAAITVGGAALLCLVAGAAFRTPVGYPLCWLAQLAGIGLGLLTGVMFVVEAVFLAVYLLAFVLGKKIDNTAPAR